MSDLHLTPRIATFIIPYLGHSLNKSIKKAENTLSCTFRLLKKNRFLILFYPFTAPRIPLVKLLCKIRNKIPVGSEQISTPNISTP